MVTDTTEAVIDTILRREGWPRYTDRPSDRGGPARGGITPATLASWRKRPVAAADVAALDEAEVRAIYRARYIEEPGFAGITDDALRAPVIDSGVNHGPARAGAWLQEGGNDLAGRLVLKVDGAVGRKTLAEVNGGGDAAGLWRSVFAQRMRFYQARPDQGRRAQRRWLVQPAGRVHGGVIAGEDATPSVFRTHPAMGTASWLRCLPGRPAITVCDVCVLSRCSPATERPNRLRRQKL